MSLSAFDQFEIIRLIPIHIFGNLDISFTNAALFMAVALFFFYFLYKTNIEIATVVPGPWQSVLELTYETVHGMVKDTLGKEGAAFFPFIFSLFIFLALMNLFGVVPYAFAPTSHIAVTLGLSFSIFMGVTILGIVNYGINYFSMFMPAGSPLILAPFLVIIEFLSHTAKAISLGVRLAANITAGHLLFAILSGFTWTMLTAGGILTVLSIFPLLIVLFITILEMAVALIQTYVFCLLTTIYISEGVHLH